MTPDYTLYLDETGDHAIGISNDVGKRYLGIAGPFVYSAFQAQLEAAIDKLKQKHFSSSGTLPVLHRKEIMQRRGPFSCLTDEARRRAFDIDLVSLIATAPYRLLAVTIDKSQHGTRAYRFLRHPYHYCLHALLERFCGLLDRLRMTGHVVAESRGKVEDYLLKEAYRGVYASGTSYLRARIAQKTLISSELEIRKKTDNISGLQLADMLAYPANRDVLLSYGRIDSCGSEFTARIIAAIRGKYNRKFGDGRVKGYGKILLS